MFRFASPLSPHRACFVGTEWLVGRKPDDPAANDSLHLKCRVAALLCTCQMMQPPIVTLVHARELCEVFSWFVVCARGKRNVLERVTFYAETGFVEP